MVCIIKIQWKQRLLTRTKEITMLRNLYDDNPLNTMDMFIRRQIISISLTFQIYVTAFTRAYCIVIIKLHTLSLGFFHSGTFQITYICNPYQKRGFW